MSGRKSKVYEQPQREFFSRSVVFFFLKKEEGIKEQRERKLLRKLQREVGASSKSKKATFDFCRAIQSCLLPVGVGSCQSHHLPEAGTQTTLATQHSAWPCQQHLLFS